MTSSETVKMKLLEGYVENRTKEIALTAIFCSLFFVTRQFRVFIAPGIYLSVAMPFLYVAATILPWRYTWVLSFFAVVTTTAIIPLKPLVGITLGIQIVYFLSRRLHGWKKVLSFVVATYPACFAGGMVSYLLGLLPFEVVIITFIPKATATAISSLLLAPPMWKILERLGVFSFEGGKNV